MATNYTKLTFFCGVRPRPGTCVTLVVVGSTRKACRRSSPQKRCRIVEVVPTLVENSEPKSLFLGGAIFLAKYRVAHFRALLLKAGSSPTKTPGVQICLVLSANT